MSSFLDEDICTLDVVDHFLKKSLGKNREIPSGSVLQVQQISNISVPKQDGQQQYDADKHILKLVLTDGDITICSLVIEPLQRINMNTPPGSKIKITQTVPVNGQIFLLTRNNHQFLGGDVPKLIEKWNFQRKMDIKQEWGATGNVGGSEGPPIWRPFGQKSTKLDVSALRKTKAMDIVNEQKDAAKDGDGSQTQFDVQRNEAISELMEKSVKQKFQKPNKHLLDKDIVIIMEEGFSIEEATEGLKRFKHPQKALKFLKARNGEYPTEDKPAVTEERKERKKRNPKDDEEEDNVPIPKEYQRPTRNISLFGFIAEHIKSDDNTADSSNDKKADDLADNFEDMNFRDRSSRGRGGRGNRGRGSNQYARGNEGNGLRRGGYSRTDSDSSHNFESRSNFPAAQKYMGARGKGYSDSRSERSQPDFSSDRRKPDTDGYQASKSYDRTGAKQESSRDQERQDYSRDHGRQEYSRDQGGQDYSGGQGRQDFSRGQTRQDFSRGPGRQESGRIDERREYSRDQGWTDHNPDHGRQDYSRGQGRQDYSRDQGRPDHNRGNGRQDYRGNQEYTSDQGRERYSRDNSGADYTGNHGRQDYGTSRQLDHWNNYPSLSQNQTPVETDSRKGYSQPPRFQKQQPSPQDTSSVPFANSSSRGQYETSRQSRLPSSQSFPQAQQQVSQNYGFNSGPRSQTNGFRDQHSEPEQYQYGSADTWNPDQTMVFTRSKPGFPGGGRSRGGVPPNSSRY